MGNCAAVKQPTSNIYISALELKQEYENMIQQIKDSRIAIIKQYSKNTTEQRDMEEDFSYFQDVKLVKDNCKGMELKFKFNSAIQQLTDIESKFQLLEKMQKNELDRKLAQIINKEQGNKTKKLLDEVQRQRVAIYDYFYSDLEVTDVPNELI